MFKDQFYYINNNNIMVLYLLFGFIAGIIGTLFSIIIRVELAYPGAQVLGNWLFFNVAIIAHTLSQVLNKLFIKANKIKVISLNVYN